ncbi:MarR family winged helix-turn-helix transcriptional regulator [Neptuniibacter halophilus]|uniref:MarR family winged helix-turn-helix transcriptional regulator n=1 Tax=Neptuniibacter halophilus TaxID=651666 RepID=UPI00257488A0|nr:MarR family transcriptional regulator [Neptuniibacter halophilus]
MNQQTDAVDRLIQQWNRERPELNADLMGPAGRLKRCAALLQSPLEEVFKQFGLNYWEFDVLATLRRSGAPYCLAPTQLFSSLMVSSGTMTHRLKGLEKRGLICRCNNPEDARSMLVQLSEEGFTLIDQAVTAHVENLDRLMSPFSEEEVEQLNQSLRRLLQTLER